MPEDLTQYSEALLENAGRLRTLALEDRYKLLRSIVQRRIPPFDPVEQFALVIAGSDATKALDDLRKLEERLCESELGVFFFANRDYGRSGDDAGYYHLAFVTKDEQFPGSKSIDCSVSPVPYAIRAIVSLNYTFQVWAPTIFLDEVAHTSDHPHKLPLVDLEVADPNVTFSPWGTQLDPNQDRNSLKRFFLWGPYENYVPLVDNEILGLPFSKELQKAIRSLAAGLVFELGGYKKAEETLQAVGQFPQGATSFAKELSFLMKLALETRHRITAEQKTLHLTGI